jgi:hypothetical protein
MAKRKLYSEPLRKVSDNASLFLVKSERPVDPGWIRYVTFGSCYDDTDTGTSIEFGMWKNGAFISMEGTATLTKSIPKMTTQATHVFRTGELPAFRVIGADASDVLLGFLEGYETEYEEVVTVG